MRRRKQSPPNKRFTGTHFGDLFMEWFKGFNRRKRATRDITGLSNEVLNYRHDLFPIRTLPVQNKPGYVHYNRNFFRVQFPNGKINKDLTELFIEDGYYEDVISYGNGHGLGEFFEMAFYELLINGVDTYAVEWGKAKINKRYYLLPIAFYWINPATVHINNNDEDKHIVQKFSFISKFIETYYEYNNHVFSKDESLIFHCHAPVSSSLKYLKKLSGGMNFTLMQGKASIEPKNHSLDIEKTRYQSSAEHWRQENMTRVKVRRLFNLPIGGFGVALTTYYEAYAYIEYKKHLNIMRDYFVTQFNKQIMKRIQVKNGFATPLQLTYQGFVSNKNIDLVYSRYKKGKMSVDELVEDVKDNYDTNTFKLL